MEFPLMDYNNCGEQVGGTAAFICTECGEGFSHYPDLLSHMVLHGTVDTFPFESPPNGAGAPLEFALHENGMLTVVDRSSSRGKPRSTSLPWNPTPPVESESTSVLPSGVLPLDSQTSPVITIPTHSASPESRSSPVVLAPSQVQSLRSCTNPANLSTTKALVGSCSARFHCETCGQSFNTRSGLQRHQRYRSLERGFKCSLCCKIFNEREELRQHLQEHAQERFYSCGQCGKRFLKQEAMTVHQEVEHGATSLQITKQHGERQDKKLDKSYPCKLCGVRFFWLSDLQSHLLNHAKGKAMSTSQGVSESEDTLQDTAPNIDLPKSTKRHETSNSSFRPYRCGLCGCRFQQISDLRLHHLSHDAPKQKNVSGTSSRPPMHGSSVAKEPKPRGRPPRGNQASHNARVYPCKLCHRVFVHSSSLSRHMRYHKGTLHTCVFCGRHFPQRCDVRRHIAMYHNAQGTHSKAETEKAVAESRRDIHLQKPQLKPLIQSQTKSQIKDLEKSTTERKRDISNYSCTKCGKMFSDASECERHGCDGPQSMDSEEVSSPARPRVTFQCNVCGKNFRLLCVYQRHQRYHKRELAGDIHKCPRCPSRFRQASALMRHLELHKIRLHLEDEKDVETSPAVSVQDSALSLDRDNEDIDDDDDFEEDTNGSVAAEVLYECTECTRTFSSLVTFLQHQSAHGSDNLG